MADPTSAALGRAASASSPLVLRVRVLRGRDLAPKDRGGTSDPYLVLTLGDARQATSTMFRTLNPEWHQTIELPVAGVQSSLVEGICWDKDRFGKDYLGEFDVLLEEIFADGADLQEPRWFPLESKRPGKKTSIVTGAVQLQFSVHDPSNPPSPALSSAPSPVVQKLLGVVGAASSPDPGEEDCADSGDALQQSQSHQDGAAEPATTERRKKRRMRVARIRKKAKEKGYEFTNGNPIAGVLFVEIQRITDLPPERNATRTSFDMDPFVVISLGRKTYRTRVIRHNLNPVYDEKLLFQVAKHETNYSISFSVVDRDNFTSNDYVGRVDLPLEKVISCAPDADPQTGLYTLPDGMRTPTAEATDTKRPRFRLGLSRSTSSQSLSKQARLTSKNIQSPGGLLSVQPTELVPPTSNPQEGINAHDLSKALTSDGPDDGFKPFVLPLNLKNKQKWESKSPTLYIRAKYLPYTALRQQFWRAMLRQYDADESGRIDKLELTTMLDSLGSTLFESTVDKFFERFPEDSPGDCPSLAFDEAVVCLEDELQRTSRKRPPIFHGVSYSSTAGDDSGSGSPSAATSSMAGLSLTPSGKSFLMAEPPNEEPLALESHDLSDDRGEEHVIEIRECPICHQPRLNKRSDSDIVTHISTCASQDWRRVNNIVMAGFVTASQAQRKWYSKVMTKISYGGYRLGANSANILVQDRVTGQIQEERMSVYVRLGIRLLYKGLVSNSMEKKRIKKLLRSMSFKQGRKYDDPASVSQIASFIAFHQLDMSEVLLPMDRFRNFNEFFYRALKPGARPCSAPDKAAIATSPADCRCVVFDRLDDAQRVWVKGRDFSVARLLAGAYPEEAARYAGSGGAALGVFRLAPQDYHRFHVPVDGVMGEPRVVDGEYYTVNPMAIRSALDVYGENLRVVVPIDSEAHGRVMVVCVGAMMVGSTVITRRAGERVRRAEELGYFKFGGSTILLLFEPGRLVWDRDLADNSRGALETLIRVGMSVGHTPSQPQHTGDGQKAVLTAEEKLDAQRRIAGGLGAEMSGSSLA